ncbi:hypothetical protein J6590_079817 [Homalodisca vitripennis]|nr:hypothetical protein J6590_079817 [Homalodisca vitripennis]
MSNFALFKGDFTETQPLFNLCGKEKHRQDLFGAVILDEKIPLNCRFIGSFLAREHVHLARVSSGHHCLSQLTENPQCINSVNR